MGAPVEDESPEEYTGFRRTPFGGEKRAVGEIAPEEIGNAVVHAVRSSGPCQVDDVFQSLNGVFGFNRTGREIRERWSEVVELLESNGRIVRRDEHLCCRSRGQAERQAESSPADTPPGSFLALRADTET